MDIPADVNFQLMELPADDELLVTSILSLQAHAPVSDALLGIGSLRGYYGMPLCCGRKNTAEAVVYGL